MCKHVPQRQDAKLVKSENFCKNINRPLDYGVSGLRHFVKNIAGFVNGVALTQTLAPDFFDCCDDGWHAIGGNQSGDG